MLEQETSTIKTEPMSPFFARCSEATIDDCFLEQTESTNILSDYPTIEDYTSERPYLPGTELLDSPDSIDDDKSNFSFDDKSNFCLGLLYNNNNNDVDNDDNDDADSLLSSSKRFRDSTSSDYGSGSFSGSDQESSGDPTASPPPSNFNSSYMDSMVDGLVDYCMNTTLSEHDILILEGRKKECLVCGDVASGLHYGVSSCEACKAFFKRTIQGNIDYTCPSSSDCEITKRRRKSCQACRYHKCIRVGMLKEGVRLDRVRGGRQKYKRNADSQIVVVQQNHNHTAPGRYNPVTALHSYCQVFPSVQSPPSAPYQVAYNTHLYKRLCLSEDHLLLTLLAIESQQETILAHPDSALKDDKDKFITVMSDLVDRELVITITWAKQVPGFMNLPLSDQMNLLQYSWLDILCLNTVMRSTPYAGYLVFADDFRLSTEKSQLYQSPTEFDQTMRKLAKKVTELKLSKEEYVLLKALVLCNPDANIENVDTITELREKIQEDLVDHVKSIKGTSSVPRRLSNLLLILPLLTHLKIASRDYWCSVKDSGQIPMHKLFLEMLEFEAGV